MCIILPTTLWDRMEKHCTSNKIFICLVWRVLCIIRVALHNKIAIDHLWKIGMYTKIRWIRTQEQNIYSSYCKNTDARTIILMRQRWWSRRACANSFFHSSFNVRIQYLTSVASPTLRFKWYCYHMKMSNQTVYGRFLKNIWKEWRNTAQVQIQTYLAALML